MKKIGPGWKAQAYDYSLGNPLSYNDPNGEEVALSFLIGFLEETVFDVLGGFAMHIGTDVIGADRDKALRVIADGVQNSRTLARMLIEDPLPLSDTWLRAGRFSSQSMQNSAIANVNSRASQSQSPQSSLSQKLSSGPSPQQLVNNAMNNPLVQQAKGVFTGATPLFNAPGSSTATTTGGGSGRPASPTPNGAAVANGHANGANQRQVVPNAPPTGQTQNRTGSNQAGGGNQPFIGPVRPPAPPPPPQQSLVSRFLGWLGFSRR